MFIDFTPLILGVYATTLGPLLVGLALRIAGRRRAARIAAAVAAAAALAVWAFIASGGGHAVLVVAPQILLAALLWAASPDRPKREPDGA